MNARFLLASTSAVVLLGFASYALRRLAPPPAPDAAPQEASAFRTVFGCLILLFAVVEFVLLIRDGVWERRVLYLAGRSLPRGSQFQSL